MLHESSRATQQPQSESLSIELIPQKETSVWAVIRAEPGDTREFGLSEFSISRQTRVEQGEGESTKAE